MFHNDNKKDEVVTTKNDVSPESKQFIHDMREAFCPIIFNDVNEKPLTYDNASNFPMFSLGVNNLASTIVLDKDPGELTIHQLHGLDSSNKNLALQILTNRIKEETLMSIMSLFDSIDFEMKDFFLKYFWIRETIERKIREDNLIDKVCHSFVYSHTFSAIDPTKESIESTAKLRNIVTNQCFTAVVSILNDAINESVDNVLLRIHLIPNIAEVRDEIIKIFNVPKEDQSADRFWVLADISIKNNLSESLMLTYPVIKQNIQNIMDSFHYTGFYIYEDELEDAYKKAEEKRNKGEYLGEF